MAFCKLLNDFAKEAFSAGKRISVRGWGVTECYDPSGKFIKLDTVTVTKFECQPGKVLFTDSLGKEYEVPFSPTKHGTDQVCEGNRFWAFDERTLNDVNLVIHFGNI